MNRTLDEEPSSGGESRSNSSTAPTLATASSISNSASESNAKEVSSDESSSSASVTLPTPSTSDSASNTNSTLSSFSAFALPTPSTSDSASKGNSTISNFNPFTLAAPSTSDSASDSSDAKECSDEEDSGKKYYGKEVTLYHYTTKEGAQSIKRDKKIKQHHPSPARSKRARHDSGIYFTRWDPESHRTNDLIKNNFCNAGKRLRNPSVFYARMQYIVRINFSERDHIEEIKDGNRDLFVHRGDIDLNKYEEGTDYRIYENPKAP